MSAGCPAAIIERTPEECSTLEKLAHRRKTSQAMAPRSRILLDCAGGLTNTQVAAKLSVAMPTVGKWRTRFARERLHGLSDALRSGQSSRITDTKVEEVVTRTLESTPANVIHWSTRSMAKASGLTQNAILRI